MNYVTITSRLLRSVGRPASRDIPRRYLSSRWAYYQQSPSPSRYPNFSTQNPSWQPRPTPSDSDNQFAESQSRPPQASFPSEEESQSTTTNRRRWERSQSTGDISDPFAELQSSIKEEKARRRKRQQPLATSNSFDPFSEIQSQSASTASTTLGETNPLSEPQSQPSETSSSETTGWAPSAPTPDITEPLLPKDRFGNHSPNAPLVNIDFEQKWAKSYGDWTIPALYDELRSTAARGLSNVAHDIIRHLINERGEEADIRIYSALILCNVNPEGSVANVLEVLKEIQEKRLQLDFNACHDVLKVLAVHPDYLLQTEILDTMKDRWYELSLEGWHDVIAGLLRSMQFEMALERLDEMQERGMTVRPWLYDMAIYILAQADELDEVLRLLQIRAELKGQIISACLWNHVLDIASRSLHYDLICLVWDRRVRRGYLNPSTGICLNVLNAAARNGDAELATDVFRMLGDRNMVFEPLHYEMLVEAYINAGELPSAFKILNVMKESRVMPDDNTIRPIVMYMNKDKVRPKEGFDILKHEKDHNSALKLPAAAMNACIESAVHHGQLELAVEFYKTMHVFCYRGADTTTFNLLIKGCVTAERKDLAMSLVKEMLSRHVQANQLTYDRLMLVCLHDPDYEDAIRYYQEMRSLGFVPRNGTLVGLVKKMAEAGDDRTARFLEDIEKMGLSTKRLRTWLTVNGASL